MSNGQVIQVRRTLEWVRGNPVGDADIWGVRVTRLTFRLPSGQVIAWSAVSEKAMILDYDQAAGEFVIVSALTGCSAWWLSGKPKPPYFEYRLRGKRWERVPLTPNLIGRTANLLLQFSHADPPQDTGLEQKRIVYEALEKSGAVPAHVLQVAADAQIPNCS